MEVNVARNRICRVEMWDGELFCSLSIGARLMYIGMKNFASDDGTIMFDSEYLGESIFKRSKTTAGAVAGFMHELFEKRLVCPYESGDNVYAVIVGFDEDQPTNRPSQSTNPQPPQNKFTAIKRGGVVVGYKVKNDIVWHDAKKIFNPSVKEIVEPSPVARIIKEPVKTGKTESPTHDVELVVGGTAVTKEERGEIKEAQTRMLFEEFSGIDGGYQKRYIDERVSAKAVEFFRYWNKLEFVSKHNPGTVAYKTEMRKIKSARNERCDGLRDFLLTDIAFEQLIEAADRFNEYHRLAHELGVKNDKYTIQNTLDRFRKRVMEFSDADGAAKKIAALNNSAVRVKTDVSGVYAELTSMYFKYCKMTEGLGESDIMSTNQFDVIKNKITGIVLKLEKIGENIYGPSFSEKTGFDIDTLRSKGIKI